jgi:DNA-binding response OmpR family regulator
MKQRILVIDDDEGVRLTVQHVLRTIGCEVRSARTCAEARQIFDKFNPAVVITDLIMPGEEGETFIRCLKKLSPDTRIVAMSGGARLGNSRILEHAREAGADRILSKPFAFDELVALVEHLAFERNPEALSSKLS